jgi:hypothetical protein
MFAQPHHLLAAPLSVLLSAFAVTSISQAHDAGITRHAANNGADGASCGSKAAPCRSIGRALQLAVDGDTILVHPGFYGDVNGDGDFTDPGDEALDPSSFPGPCLVCINKRVRLLSTHGADLTIIDGFGTESFGPVNGVAIFASGVTFGSEARGFTVRRMSNTGVLVQPEAGDVTIAGNHASENGVDDDSSGIGFVISVSAGLTRVRNNRATHNDFYGFLVASNTANPGVARVVANAAHTNRFAGFVIESGTGPAYSIIGNVATGNPGGFSFDGRGLVARRNVAMNNNVGMQIEGDASNVLLTENSIIGNLFGGVSVGLNVPGPIDIHRSNIYGNAGTASSSIEMNCGISNQSERQIDARNNFWGLPGGPGADPADNVGPGTGCDVGIGSETLFAPFASKPFPIQPRVVYRVETTQDKSDPDASDQEHKGDGQGKLIEGK